jgi:hypothetical protein
MSDFASTYISDRGDGNLCLGSAIDLKRGMKEHARTASAMRFRLPLELLHYPKPVADKYDERQS